MNSEGDENLSDSGLRLVELDISLTPGRIIILLILLFLIIIFTTWAQRIGKAGAEMEEPGL